MYSMNSHDRISKVTGPREKFEGKKRHSTDTDKADIGGVNPPKRRNTDGQGEGVTRSSSPGTDYDGARFHHSTGISGRPQDLEALGRLLRPDTNQIYGFGSPSPASNQHLHSSDSPPPGTPPDTPTDLSSIAKMFHNTRFSPAQEGNSPPKTINPQILMTRKQNPIAQFGLTDASAADLRQPQQPELPLSGSGNPEKWQLDTASGLRWTADQLAGDLPWLGQYATVDNMAVYIPLSYLQRSCSEQLAADLNSLRDKQNLASDSAERGHQPTLGSSSSLIPREKQHIIRNPLTGKDVDGLILGQQKECEGCRIYNVTSDDLAKMRRITSHGLAKRELTSAETKDVAGPSQQHPEASSHHGDGDHIQWEVDTESGLRWTRDWPQGKEIRPETAIYLQYMKSPKLVVLMLPEPYRRYTNPQIAAGLKKIVQEHNPQEQSTVDSNDIQELVANLRKNHPRSSLQQIWKIFADSENIGDDWLKNAVRAIAKTH